MLLFRGRNFSVISWNIESFSFSSWKHLFQKLRSFYSRSCKVSLPDGENSLFRSQITFVLESDNHFFRYRISLKYKKKFSRELDFFIKEPKFHFQIPGIGKVSFQRPKSFSSISWKNFYSKAENILIRKSKTFLPYTNKLLSEAK